MPVQLDHTAEKTASRPPIERPLRLATGLVLLAYATTHFINHAFGIRSVEAMQKASAFLLAPWQTTIGRTLLYTAFLVHGILGLKALYRRRHLRMPASEAWQLGLGLAIPLLLIPHVAAIRLADMAYGLFFDFPRVLYELWVTAPVLPLSRQLLLLLVVWIHACIGIRSSLASKRWYPRAVIALGTLATLIPALALLGFANAGLDMRELARGDPESALRHGPPDPTSAAGHGLATVGLLVDGLVVTYLTVVAGVLALRAVRDWHARRFGGLRITYPGGRLVTVPVGFSVLEASRWADIPHESICGGRGRCSTCRIRIGSGARTLADPGPVERRTLDRIKAPPHVRLACQLRPAKDVSVHPLVRPSRHAAAAPTRFAAAVTGGSEQEIVAMFVDLRDSTRLANGRLPYDALFLLDRYIQVITGAILRHDGHVTSVAGDGVMSVFGAEGAPAAAARQALAAARDAWSGLDALNDELATELSAPLRIGIGLHAGPAVVGWIPAAGAASLQFLGDTGNVAAKLEAQTKDLGCTLIASRAVLELIALRPPESSTRTISIAGNAIEVVTLARHQDLEWMLVSSPRP
jgi:adenylate cyclase